MNKRVLLLMFLGTILLSCEAKVRTKFYENTTQISSDSKVAILLIQHRVPESAKKLGEAKFGDNAFSVDCGFDSNLVKARKIARKNGANIVKITKHNKPDLWSSCHRIQVEFYSYEGNVEELTQYQIKIN